MAASTWLELHALLVDEWGNWSGAGTTSALQRLRLLGAYDRDLYERFTDTPATPLAGDQLDPRVVVHPLLYCPALAHGGRYVLVRREWREHAPRWASVAPSRFMRALTLLR